MIVSLNRRDALRFIGKAMTRRFGFTVRWVRGRFEIWSEGQLDIKYLPSATQLREPTREQPPPVRHSEKRVAHH